MRQPLTERQTEIYRYMRDHLAGWHSLPTIREIGGRFGIGSPNGVMAHLLALEKHGWIARTPKGGGSGKRGGWMLSGVKMQLVDEATPAQV